jgi:hypothetical protein
VAADQDHNVVVGWLLLDRHVGTGSSTRQAGSVNPASGPMMVLFLRVPDHLA